jgi:hypothetical protein
MIKLKIIELSESPSLTPFVIVVGLDVLLFDFIRAIVSVFNYLVILTIYSGDFSFSQTIYNIGQSHPMVPGG